MSREGNLAKNTLILSIGTILPKFGALVTLPILTGCLTKSEYGSYDLILIMMSLLYPLVTLQLQGAAFRFLIDARHDELQAKIIVSNVFVPIALLSLVVSIILFIALPGSLTIRAGMGLCITANSFSKTLRNMARGLGKTLEYSLSAIISASCKVIYLSVLVWGLGLGLMGAIIALASSSITSICILMHRTKIYRYFDLSLVSTTNFKPLISYSWPMIFVAMSGWILRVSDRIVIAMFLGITANAIYAVANKIPHLLNLLQNSFTMAWHESASIAVKDSDAEEYYSSMFGGVFNMLAGLLGLLIATTPITFALLIRNNYSEAYPQMPILYMAMFFECLCSYLHGIYFAFKATKSIGASVIATAICNLIINFSAIKFIGLYAASGSTLLSYLFLFVFRLFNVRRLVKIHYDFRHMSLVLALLTLECTLCFFRDIRLDILNMIIAAGAFVVLNQSAVKGLCVRAYHKLKQRKGGKQCAQD